MNDLEAAIAAIWDRSRPLMRERLDRVRAAADGLTAGTLAEEVRVEGARAAHQLAGSLGSFGMPEGSELARALEAELGGPRDPGRVAQLSGRLHEIVTPRLA